MPLLNIFTGKELDDWSGKKTVKTGQQATRSVTTAASSVGTDNALPSSSAPGFISPITAFSKDSVASSKDDYSTDASTDGNSTTVVNEGRSVEQMVVSDSEDGETLDGVDEFSLEGYGGGCMDCHDLLVDDPDDYIDSEAIQYWKRVKANRQRSSIRKPPACTFSNMEHVEEEADNTQIEVVHDEKSKPSPSRDVERETEAVKPRSLLKIVKSLSKGQRDRKGEHSNVDATYRADCDRPLSLEESNIYDSPGGEEVEADAKKSGFSRLAKMISKSKLLSRDTNETAIDHSCASSTEDRWAKYEDKYKTPDESDSSFSREQESNDGMDANIAGRPGDESMLQSILQPDDATEESADLVGIIPETELSKTDLLASSPGETPKRHGSIRHASTRSNVAAAETRPTRARASLWRIAKSMKFNSEGFSGANGIGGSNERETGNNNEQNKRGSMLKRASQSARLNRLGKGIKLGVSRMKKFGKRRSLSEPNLVVCIDGKGDRLNPSDANHKPEDAFGKKHSETEQESEDSSFSTGIATTDDSPSVLVEANGPLVMEMCLMSSDLSLEPNEVMASSTFDEETRTLYSSSIETRENAGWFLTHVETQKKGMARTCTGTSNQLEKKYSEDDLSRWGVETPYGWRVLDSEPDACSIGSASDSLASESDSSEGDLNTYSTCSVDDDSIIYELFPTNSFSSLTGIKCQVGCTELKPMQSSSSVHKTTEVLARGRSRFRSHGRHSSRGRLEKELQSRAGLAVHDSIRSFGFNGIGAQDDGEEEDSIFECAGDRTVGSDTVVHLER